MSGSEVEAKTSDVAQGRGPFVPRTSADAWLACRAPKPALLVSRHALSGGVELSRALYAVGIHASSLYRV